MADVFISYKSERRAAAAHLAEILGDFGYSVWWDYGLAAGDDFGPHIERELRNAKAVVVLWCGRSAQSQWVRAEATLAKRLDKLVPARIEEVDPPLDFLLDHTIDLSEWDGAAHGEALERLVRDIANIVGREPTPARMTARRWEGGAGRRLAQFELGEALERRFGARVLPSAGALVAKGGWLGGRNLAYAGLAAVALSALVLGWRALSQNAGAKPAGDASPPAAASKTAPAIIAAQRLEGRWRALDDPGCRTPFTLALAGETLSFSGPDTAPFAEPIVGLDGDGAVRTDVAGTPAIYRLDGAVLVFTYGGAPLRYARC